MRQLSLLPFAAALLLAAAGRGFAQGPAAPPPALPVRDVTLFSSGVAYVERSGRVEGSATITLAFPVDTVPDILKSLVLHAQGRDLIVEALQCGDFRVCLLKERDERR